MLGSLLSQTWVKSKHWSGGILRINSGANSGKHYSEMDCSNCIYSKLSTAGVVMIVFELLSLLLTLVWLAYLVFQSRGVEIFKRVVIFPVLALTVLFHWVGIITWGAVTGLSFDSSPHSSSTGVALSVSVSVMQPLIEGIFLLVFKVEREHIPEMHSVRFERRHRWSEQKNMDCPDNKN
jgi:hypothetical protein